MATKASRCMAVVLMSRTMEIRQCRVLDLRHELRAEPWFW